MCLTKSTTVTVVTSLGGRVVDWDLAIWRCCFFFFFFNDTATTEIYTLSLHDALPICVCSGQQRCRDGMATWPTPHNASLTSSVSHKSTPDRKSTRLNSSHTVSSYAVFCLKKKNVFSIANSFPSLVLSHIIYCVAAFHFSSLLGF